MLTRRHFIKSLAAAAGCSLLPMRGSAFALYGPDVAQHRLVVLLLRGAVDGLSVVVPYHEREYYNVRRNIALQPPGTQDGVVDLDGFFGLHPSLSNLMPLWQDKSLAFVHASGFPTNVRSHFEAQDIIETACLNPSSRGWMNSLIGLLPDTRSPMRAVTFSRTLPKIFTGRYNVAVAPPNMNARSKEIFTNQKVEGAFDSLYASNPQLSILFKEGKDSHNQMVGDLQKEMTASGRNAPFPGGFPGEAARLAAMIKQDPNIELAFMDLGGWDTHVGQGNAKGQLSEHLRHLSEGLAALVNGLGTQYSNTTIMIMSEFGRTVAENGNNGTDHGHGNVIWLIGGGVQGGKVHGRWPGLAHNQLFEQRDLAVTTDFRSVIGSVLTNRFGLDAARIAQAIPDYQPDNGLNLFG